MFAKIKSFFLVLAAGVAWICFYAWAKRNIDRFEDDLNGPPLSPGEEAQINGVTS